MDAPELPVLYKRKYADGDRVSSQDLREAYRMAAALVARGGDDYLPIFERLDREIEQRQKKNTVKERALEVARRNGVDTFRQ